MKQQGQESSFFFKKRKKKKGEILLISDSYTTNFEFLTINMHYLYSQIF